MADKTYGTPESGNKYLPAGKNLIGTGPGGDIYQYGASLGVTSDGGSTGGSSKKTTSSDKNSPYSTTYQATGPSTKTTVTDPTTATNISEWTPTKDRPTYQGAIATANLPGAPVAPEYDTPTYGELDPFVARPVNMDRISELTTMLGAPARRGLNQSMRDISHRRFDNPNVGALTLRQALTGYGTGLEGIISSAGTAARGQEASERAALTEADKINYAEAGKVRDAIYQGDLHSADVNWQAQFDLIKLTYGAEVAAEIQRVADQNKRDIDIFDSAMDEYLATGTRTTTSTTAGGKQTTTTSGGTVITSKGPFDKDAVENASAADNIASLKAAYIADRTNTNLLAWKRAKSAEWKRKLRGE